MLRTPPALALALALAGAPALTHSALADPAEPQRVHLDAETTVNGVPLACTGIGQTRADPKWGAYPIRLEFAGPKNEYMADAVVALSDAKGRPVLTVRCDGPWVLLKPAPGRYAVHAQLADSPAKPRSAQFTVPAHGQQRVVLQFPDAF